MRIDKYYSGNDTPAQDKEQHEHHHEEHHAKKPGIDTKMEAIFANKYTLIAVVLLILAINVIMRAGLLQYQGLFEPDAFFYYATILQAIHNHFFVTNYLNLSGFPAHNFIGETRGLIYLAVVPYWLLHGITGISALTIIRWLAIVFGVMYAILAYFLAKQITNKRTLGLLAMILVSLSSGNIARTAGTIFRGDSFITLPIMVALILMIASYGAKSKVRKYTYAILSAFALSLGVVVWNGSPFIIVAYMLGLLFVICYGFIAGDSEILFSSVVLSLSLALTNILERLYIYIGIARAVELTSNSFLVFYVPLLLGSILAYLIVTRKDKLKFISAFVSTARSRAIVLAVMALFTFAVLFVGFGPFIKNLAEPLSTATVNSTGAVQTNATKQAIVTTTQELQPPSIGFLWSSFNFQLYLAPLGVVIFIIFTYLLIRRSRILDLSSLNLNIVAFLIILAYFAVTAYLQSTAIRFNAIISTPLAIFAAFGIFALAWIFYNIDSKNRLLIAVVLVATLAVTVFILYSLYPGFGSASRIVYISIALIFALLGIAIVYELYGMVKGHIKFKYLIIAAIIGLLIFNLYNTYFESYTASQADGINPQFLAAMSWMKNNTPSNATVLALWPDGSVIEGWANRTSYMDSVGGENGTRIFPFSQFLFNTSPDVQYLYSIGKPQYLVARDFWYAELGGIAQEGLVQNASAFGYVQMEIVNSTNNATAQFFSFESPSSPYYKTELVITQEKISNSSYTDIYHAFLGVANSSRLSLLRGVIFLNTSSGKYNIFNESANQSINYSMMVTFTGTQITGGYILGPKLVSSNLYKFTFLCNLQTCPYYGSGVSMQAVYINGDTRIYKINYS